MHGPPSVQLQTTADRATHHRRARRCHRPSRPPPSSCVRPATCVLCCCCASVGEAVWPDTATPLCYTEGVAHGSVSSTGTPWCQGQTVQESTGINACKGGAGADAAEALWRGGGQAASAVVPLAAAPRAAGWVGGKTKARGHSRSGDRTDWRALARGGGLNRRQRGGLVQTARLACCLPASCRSAESSSYSRL